MEGWRERILTVGKGLRERAKGVPPRRVWATAMALLLWLEMGGMRGSVIPEEAEDEGGFGEVHWYEGA